MPFVRKACHAALALACATALMHTAAARAAAQAPEHKAEPWLLSVSHRIDLDRYADRMKSRIASPNVQVERAGRRHVINLIPGVLVDDAGHVVTRLVNLDPTATEFDLHVTTRSGRILEARLVGVDQPTGLAVLEVPELKGTAPAPGSAPPDLANGAEVRVVRAEYRINQISVPIERVALYPSLRVDEGHVQGVSSAAARAGVVARIQCGTLTSSADLSVVETRDGRFCGLLVYVSPGVGTLLSVPYVRDTVAHRVVDADGSVAAAWLGASGVSVKDLPDERRPAWAEGDGVLIQSLLGNGPAANAGLKLEDVVVGYDQVPIHDTSDLATALGATPAGSTIDLRVLRGGESVVVTTMLGAQPLAPGMPPITVTADQEKLRRQVAMLNAEIARSRDTSEQARLRAQLAEIEQRLDRLDPILRRRLLVRFGVTVQALTNQLREFFGVAHGVLVSEVVTASPAGEAGILAGDIIVRAGADDVTTEESLIETVARAIDAKASALDLVIMRKGTSTSISIPLARLVEPAK